MVTRQVFRLMASASFIGATVWACSGGTGNTGFTDTNTNSTNGTNTNSTNGSSSTTYGNGSTTTNNGGTTTNNGGTTTTTGGNTTSATSTSLVGGGGTGCAGAGIYAPTTCDATKAAGALAVSACYYTGTAGTAAMGYVYPYGDGTSTACVDSAALCGKGSVGAQNPPTYSIYGSGFGVNVNQASGATTSGSVTPTASGLTWAVSGTIPAGGLQISITAGTGPCAAASGCCFRPAAGTMSGMTSWSSFTQACYNPPAEAGAGLSMADGISKINFQGVSGMAASTYDFCVTALSF